MSGDDERRPHLLSWRAARGLPEKADMEVERHAASLARDRWPQASKLTDDQREQVHVHMDALADAHAERVAEHRRRLMAVARRFGRRVAQHEITLADASGRLDALAQAPDPEAPVPTALVPYSEACDIARDNFVTAYREVMK